jgi:hypothetical protein
MAVVHLFFTDTQFTGFVKSELFGFTEFLCKFPPPLLYIMLTVLQN